jgi:hypothetical protein
VPQTRKICFFEESALRHIANASKSDGGAVEVASREVKGVMRFDAQLERKPLTQGGNSPHDARFEHFDHNPSVSTKHP